MKKSSAMKVRECDRSEEFCEAVYGEKDGRCSISDSPNKGMVRVFWFSAPNSIAPGGPAIDVPARRA